MTNRLPESSTQVFNRSKPVTIYFQGKPIKAFEGDTVASALLDAGTEAFSRSFKYHRHRSASCLSGQCSRCTMNVDGRMHVRTCQTYVREGMTVEPQDSLGIDLKGVADSVSLQTGFYYKSFYKPQWVWDKTKEKLRTMPGNLAKFKKDTTKVHVEEVNLTPEILVIGGGLAGMEAALTAAKAGLRVVLAESDPQLGGFDAFQGEEGYRRAQESIRRLEEYDNLTILTSTLVSAIFPDDLAVCVQSCNREADFLERTYLVRPKATIIATGAISKPMIFTHNDRPGVILPEAAQRLTHMWGIKPGSSVLLAGGDDYVAKVALELLEKGISLAGLVDFRAEGVDADMRTALFNKGVKIWNGYTLVEARGRRKVQGAVLAALDGSDTQTVKCDTIVASSGRYPRHKLLGQSGARMVFDPELNFHLPQSLPPAYQAAGRVLGLENQEAIKAQGKMAAAKALKRLGIEAASIEQEAAAILDKASAVKAVPRQAILSKDKKKTFVCYCNDVTESDVEYALAEGFENIETVKRYTTATMGMCQGGMCEANFAHVLAQKQQTLKARVLPTPRPPATSITLASLASGHHDYPQRTPLHHAQLEQGALLTRLGDWIRAEDFGDPEAESLAVHNAAGICDVSTIGKFRVYGRDAEKLINRVITKKVENLRGNKIMYHAVCNEEGILLDDGIVLKVGEHDYFVTTLTGRAPFTEEWFARWSREEEWQVGVVNLTETLAGMTIAGPKSREILSQLTDADISNEALPFMNWAQIEMAGVKVRVMRMGFEGELCLELNCPSSQAVFLWNRILEVGKPSGLRPFGFEAMNICRLEKGHVVPGLDTDGNTNLFEASFGWLLDRTKTETVGKPMLDLLEGQEFKQQVIAFSVDGRSPVKDGSLVVDGPRRFGHVTVVRYSPILDKTIGLALVEPNENWREGGIVKLWFEGREIEAGFVKPPFYDPNGERMKI